ncbi:MAG: hypothetical protein Q8Q23_05515 [bacterium]|nr:hypothetical protein [bacterium]
MNSESKKILQTTGVPQPITGPFVKEKVAEFLVVIEDISYYLTILIAGAGEKEGFYCQTKIAKACGGMVLAGGEREFLPIACNGRAKILEFNDLVFFLKNACFQSVFIYCHTVDTTKHLA